MKVTGRNGKEKTILFLYGIFGTGWFKIFLLATEIQADVCISHDKFIEEHYKEIWNSPDNLWFDV